MQAKERNPDASQCIHEHFPVHVPIVLVFPSLSNQAALMHRSMAILPIFFSARQIMVLFNFVLREASDTHSSGVDSSQKIGC